MPAKPSVVSLENAAGGEGIGDNGVDAFGDSETSPSGAATMCDRRESNVNVIPGENLLRLVVNITAAGRADTMA